MGYLDCRAGGLSGGLSGGVDEDYEPFDDELLYIL